MFVSARSVGGDEHKVQAQLLSVARFVERLRAMESQGRFPKGSYWVLSIPLNLDSWHRLSRERTEYASCVCVCVFASHACSTRRIHPKPFVAATGETSCALSYVLGVGPVLGPRS